MRFYFGVTLGPLFRLRVRENCPTQKNNNKQCFLEEDVYGYGFGVEVLGVCT